MPVHALKFLLWSVRLCCRSDNLCHAVIFLQRARLQQCVRPFHPSLTTAVVCPHRCSHAHTHTETLSIFPLRSLPHNWIPMWEMSQQLWAKANQRNLLPVQNEGWPLDWGVRNVSGPRERRQIKTCCESELGKGWWPGADHRAIRKEGMRPSF